MFWDMVSGASVYSSMVLMGGWCCIGEEVAFAGEEDELDTLDSQRERTSGGLCGIACSIANGNVQSMLSLDIHISHPASQSSNS